MKRPDTSTPRKKITKEALKKSLRLFRYISPFKGYFIISLLALIISSLSSLIVFSKLGSLVDLTQDNILEKIWPVTILLGGVLVVSAVSSFVRIYTSTIVAENAVANIRVDVYKKLISLPMQYLSGKRVGELSSTVASDVTAIQSALTTYIAEFLRQLITIVGALAIMSYTSYKLALFMLLTLPIMAIFAVMLGRKVRKLGKQAQEKIAESNSIVEETLQAIQSVKTFTGELFEIKRYNKSAKELVQIGMKNSIYRGVFASVIVVVIFGSIIGIVWFGSSLVANKEITTGDLFSFFFMSGLMAGSVGGLADIYAQIQKAIGSTENLLDIMDEQPEINERADFVSRKRFLEGNISFQNVSFTYNDRKDFPVLHNLNFDISQGSQVAIVGPSGSGKSTMMSLLLRFYDVNEGMILIDGKNILDFDISEYRSQLAIVPQDILLFGGSIKENIRYGTFDATDEEIIEAAKKANAHDFIMSFPEGYDTIVGERGTKLSGGQRQRVAIARAVLSNPAVLLLDEATSSLDSESEKQVQDALDKLMEGRTSIVVAHRLSTIRNADRILVLDKGVIVEQGTHHELIEVKGLYSYLSELQYH